MPCAWLHTHLGRQQQQQRSVPPYVSVQQVPAVHGVQLLEVCVEAEGLDVDLQCRHRVLHTKGSQNLWVDDAKETHLHRHTHMSGQLLSIALPCLPTHTHIQAHDATNMFSHQAQPQPQTHPVVRRRYYRACISSIALPGVVTLQVGHQHKTCRMSPCLEPSGTLLCRTIVHHMCGTKYRYVCVPNPCPPPSLTCCPRALMLACLPGKKLGLLLGVQLYPPPSRCSREGLVPAAAAAAVAGHRI